MKIRYLGGVLLLFVLSLNPILVGALSVPDFYNVTTVPASQYSEGRGQSISSNGKYVIFKSKSSELVTNDNNGLSDVFRKDVETGEVVAIDVDANGDLAQHGASFGSASDDGSKILFFTYSSLISEDTNANYDAYIKDLATNTTSLVCLNNLGQQCNRNLQNGIISSNGSVLVFKSESSNLVETANTYVDRIYKKNLLTNTIEILSLPTQGTANVVDMSSDGRYIVYLDIFTEQIGGSSWRRDNVRVYDTQTNTSVYVNVSSVGGISNHPGSGGPSISNDGRYVAFWSRGSNLVNNDTNDKADVFVRDMVASTTERVSVSTNGAQGTSNSFGAKISSDGRYVLFDSNSAFVPRTYGGIAVYIHDRLAHESKRITADIPLGNQEFDSFGDYDISVDNSYLAFWTGYTLYHRSVAAIFNDITPPDITYSINPGANYNGWNKTSVNLTWEITDDSAIASHSGCEPQTVSADTTTSGLTYTCTATSRGGTTIKSVTVKYDSTAPTVSYTRTPPNANGWNNSNVTVTFNCSDTLSGIDVCSEPVTIDGETAGQSTQGTAIDRAGNISTLTTTLINIDKTLPGGSFNNGSSTVVKLLGQTIAGTATDVTSGVAKVTLSAGTTTLTSNSGGGITLSCDADQLNCTWTANNALLPTGVNTYSLTITDLADNTLTTTRQYTVL